MPIPKRIVEAQPEAIFSAGIRHCPDDVGLIRGVIDGIGGGVRIPQAKAVVVLGDQDDIIHPRLISRAHPTVRIDRRGAVALDRQRSVRPLRVVERVDTKVEEHTESALHLR